MSALSGSFLLYAPNVHTGGGFVLLQALLHAWPDEQPLVAWLDERVRGYVSLPADAQVKWIKATVKSRLIAECSLFSVAKVHDRVLCFHGLPPLLRSKASVQVFLQNRILLGNVSLGTFSWKTRQRIRFEQCISRMFRCRVARYWVQTPSMARLLRVWFEAETVDVRVLPFALPSEPVACVETPCWDFVYVADGEAHKNHRRLIDAWRLLAEEGLRPSLALTLSKRDTALAAWVQQRACANGLKVNNLGQMPHDELLKLYGKVRALIFPSLSESFGLPLIEARNASLPILAGELDFVRDVCEPVESFDPHSPVSIARAVKRFLGKGEPPLQPTSATEFLMAIMH